MLLAVFYLLLRRLVALAGGSAPGNIPSATPPRARGVQKHCRGRA